MLTPERITDLPTAEELESGYYVLVDSPTLGTRKIAVENFIPPDKDIYRWDFIKSLIDEKQGIEFVLNKNRDNYPTLNQNGLYFQRTSSSGAGRAVATLNENLFGKTIEIDYGETNIQQRYSNEQEFFSFSSYGYIYWNGSNWGLRNASSGGWNGFSTEFGANYFSNKTLKLVVYENSKVDVYAIDNGIETKLNTSDIIEPNGYISNKIYLGSGDSLTRTIGINFTVKAVRVYENE
jgi:hypothetical protein